MTSSPVATLLAQTQHHPHNSRDFLVDVSSKGVVSSSVQERALRVGGYVAGSKGCKSEPMMRAWGTLRGAWVAYLRPSQKGVGLLLCLHPPGIQNRSRCQPLVLLLVEGLWGCIVTTRSTGRLSWSAL